MVDFDGSEFIAIDDEAYTVVSGPYNPPLDVFLRSVARGNAEYLLQGRDQVSTAYRAGAVTPSDGAPYYGDRAWCSVDWTCVQMVPFWFEGGVLGAEVAFWLYHGNSAIGDVEIRIDLVDGTLTRVLATTSITTDGEDFESGTNGHVTATLEMATPYAGSAHFGALMVWIRSELGAVGDAWDAASVDGGFITNANKLITLSSSGAYGYDGSSIPAANTLDVSYILAGDDSQQVADLVSVSTGNGTTTNDAILIDRPIYTGGDLYLVPMAYVCCRAMSIRRKRRRISATLANGRRRCDGRRSIVARRVYRTAPR